ncbi:hypothetical protein [Paraflavitalea pollutisoli]|uniref:hypothetical protein n=1 Tax=Paraflavitalea pollutisoli TaxID=3034143 RepID=UPI0023EDA9AC|nr:hypothetical protein [Paraflavitalea sp. H1-2-19X]
MYKVLLIAFALSACNFNRADPKIVAQQREAKRREAVVKILTARLEASEEIQGEGIGISGTPSATYESFKLLDGLLSDTAWLQLTYSKSPVMRVYAYQALQKRNKAMTEEVKVRLSHDDASFTMTGGCTSMPNTVRGYVTGTLDSSLFIMVRQ